jgi:hypothetical protein
LTNKVHRATARRWRSSLPTSRATSTRSTRSDWAGTAARAAADFENGYAFGVLSRGDKSYEERLTHLRERSDEEMHRWARYGSHSTSPLSNLIGGAEAAAWAELYDRVAGLLKRVDA